MLHRCLDQWYSGHGRNYILFKGIGVVGRRPVSNLAAIEYVTMVVERADDDENNAANKFVAVDPDPTKHCRKIYYLYTILLVQL